MNIRAFHHLEKQVEQGGASGAGPMAQMLLHHHPLPERVGWWSRAWSGAASGENAGGANHPLPDSMKDQA